MKITNTPPVQAVYEVSRAAPAAGPAQSSSEPHASVSISSDAQWLSELRDTAEPFGPVREGLVSEVQSQIADGSFASSVDMDAVLDELLADL
jgi:anti-sigma28 factor (negative regulator of flagellin synthesis)